MSQDNSPQVPESLAKPLNIVIGGSGIGLLIAAAGFAFLKSQKSSAGEIASRVVAGKPNIGKPSLKGKWALNTVIKMIEHDTSRKVLLGVLKAMAKRAK